MEHTSGKLLSQRLLFFAVLWFVCVLYTACPKAGTAGGSVPAGSADTGQTAGQKASLRLAISEQYIIYYDNRKQLEKAFSLAAPEAVEFIPYPMQKRPAAFIPIDKTTVLLAVNKTGFVQISVQKQTDKTALLMFDTNITAEGVPISDYSAGTVWQTNDHHYLLLYKDHILDTNWTQTVIYDFYGDTVSRLDIPPFPGNKNYVPFWVFPAKNNTWLIQYRYADGERAYTAFAQWNRAGNKISELAKTSFEKLLIPLNFDKTPAPLQAIGRTISEPVLLEYRQSDGSIIYINNSNLDDAMLGIAETNAAGTFVLLEDGRYWIFPTVLSGTLQSVQSLQGQTSSISKTPQQQQQQSVMLQPIHGQFSVPLDDIHFKSGLFTGTLFIASWEENGIPDTGRSGLAIIVFS